jgi:hypothetical protein
MARVARMGESLCSVAGLVPKGSRVLTLLDDNLGVYLSAPMTCSDAHDTRMAHIRPRVGFIQYSYDYHSISQSPC